MNKEIRKTLKKLFQDKDGVLVLWQSPNIPLIVWFITLIITRLIPVSGFSNSVERVGTAFLLVWAYLEITSGVNYFRKLLGLAVMVFVVASYFIK